MNHKRIIVFENDGRMEPDICGQVIDLINSEISGSKNMSIATIFVDPGKESKMHFHKKMEEIYYILDGKGEININGIVTKIKKGYAILLPVGSKHQIRNTGQKVLKFISVDSPSFEENDIYIE